MSPAPKDRVVVAITGASGSIYGIRLLEALAKRRDVETHLVLTKAGVLTLRQETDRDPGDIRSLADVAYSPGEIGASIASGSFRVRTMIVAPCSIKTLSAIANSYSGDLVSRAADVTLKEGRPLVLMVRETPFHLGHLRLMTAAAEAGAIIAPPVPAFYHLPRTVEELVDHSVQRVLDRVGLGGGSREWQGLEADREPQNPMKET